MEAKEFEEKKEEEENIITTDKSDEKKDEKIDPHEIEKNKIKLLLKEANEEMSQNNYKKAEEKYNLIIQTKNKEILKNIKAEIDDIMLKYSYCAYYQMKYEEASKILYDILINYNSKNKGAYLLFLKILCDINEYKKAKLLLEKVKVLFKINENESSEFFELEKNIEKYFKIKNNNLERQFYYNAEKEIFKFRKNMNFFYWCFYSFGALLLGHYLSKLFL